MLDHWYGSLGAGPPPPHDRFARVLHLVSGSAPFFVVLWGVETASISGNDILRLVLCVLIAVRVWSTDRRLSHLERTIRTTRRYRRAFILVTALVLLALSPGLSTLDGGSRALGVGLVILGTAVSLLGSTWQNLRSSGAEGCVWMLLAPFHVLQVLLAYGWLPALVATAVPEASILVPAALVMTYLEIGAARSLARNGDWALRIDGAVQLARTRQARTWYPLGLAAITDCWVYDAVIQQDEPDLSLWEMMVRHDETLEHHPLGHTIRPLWRQSAPMPDSDSEPWISIADSFADTLRTFHMKYPHLIFERHSQLFAQAWLNRHQRSFLAARAITAMARAEASYSTGEFDFALQNRRYAAELFQKADLPLNSVVAQCLAADLLLFELDRPREASEMLRGMDGRLYASPAVTGLVLILRAKLNEPGAWRSAKELMPLLPDSALAVFQEQPTWLPFLNDHGRAVKLGQFIEGRFRQVGHELGHTIDDMRGGRYPRLVSEESLKPRALDTRNALTRAQTCFDSGDLEHARELALEAVTATEANGHIVHQAEAHRLLADVAEAERDWARCFTELEAALGCVEHQRRRVKYADIRIDLNFSPISARMVELIVDRRVPHIPLCKAVDLAERGKARSLLDSEAEVNAILHSAVRREFSYMSIDPAHTRRKRAVRESREDPTSRGGSSANGPADFDQLRDVLPSGVVLCEIVWRRSRLFLLLVRADQAEPTAITLPFPQAASVQPIRFRDPARLRKLLQPLTQALVTFTEPGETLWIVPDGRLHDLPLHVGDAGDMSLGERNPMCVSPSASVMLPHLSRSPQPPPSRALVLGDSSKDLPHSQAEARAIASLFDTTDLYTGDAATVKTLARRLREEEFDVVHLACHCKVNRDQPILSELRLADGTLPTIELSQIPADTRLVALSGCHTGTQQHRRGNELIGPSRVLLAARVPTILVSHWAADDFSTALLMEDFYREWRRGRSVAQALCVARRILRKLTCGEAIQRCEEWLTTPGNESITQHITSEITRLTARSAAAKLSVAGREPSAEDPRERIRLMRDALRQAQLDRATPAFDDPHHLAPFTLIGDWR